MSPSGVAPNPGDFKGKSYGAADFAAQYRPAASRTELPLAGPNRVAGAAIGFPAFHRRSRSPSEPEVGRNSPFRGRGSLGRKRRFSDPLLLTGLRPVQRSRRRPWRLSRPECRPLAPSGRRCARRQPALSRPLFRRGWLLRQGQSCSAKPWRS